MEKFDNSTRYNLSIIFRSLALFAILYQLRLLAADLSDTPVFIATLLTGFAAAVFLYAYGQHYSNIRLKKIQINPLAALLSIALIPWLCRAFIALPRFFIPQQADALAITLDSLLLHLDRNNFSAILPFYWIAASTWFSLRSAKFLRGCVIADIIILLIIYSIARTANIDIYRWPIVMIILFAIVVFLQTLSLLFSIPVKLRIKEICYSIAALLIIITLGGFLFLKPFQEQAVEMGGGLLKPNLFNFDFSQFLKLESEISMKNDLVLIVKKDYDRNIFLRRSVLSGYGQKQGFYKIEELDEKTHPQKLPDRQITLEPKEFELSNVINQEYFLVNFDASAFIGMKEPVEITPYENWDASSFNSAYAVKSLVSKASGWSLSRSKNPLLSAQEFGLSDYEYKIYTEYGNDDRLYELSKEITAKAGNYNQKINAIFQYLKNGEFRYSLKPGIAPDGDQLGYFLFKTKKGYCSYFSFAMTLLLRSQGIPARVAAGFFIDPDSETFDYYPVRSDMAHAWVEVCYPDFGWIEYDPTTENLAEGEEFQFSSGVDAALFEKLMREIFENRSGLKVKQGKDDETPSNLQGFTRIGLEILRNYRLYIMIALLSISFIVVRCGIYLSVFVTRNPRKKAVRLAAHACRRLSLAGIRRKFDTPHSEWCQEMDIYFPGMYALYQREAAARFAPDFMAADYAQQKNNYKIFSDSYCKKIPLWRRLCAWIFPPIALAVKLKPLVLLILFIGLLAGVPTQAQMTDDFRYADELYEEASGSEYSEMWDRAIQLYRSGEELFPDDVRFPWSLGNLYFNRSLYGLAWDEFKKVDMIMPDTPDILMRLARTAGYLNRDAQSVEYYERVLGIEDDNRDAIGSLGWMYFKVHRLADGERLLSSAIKRFGEDADYSMTLGTVYSDMYRYDDSKYYYTDAIKQGEMMGDRNFAAVAWYNLSILETHFYKFNLAMDATNASLNMQNRASGRIALGEIFMRRMELEKSQKEFQTAYELDSTPLAKLNLAIAYQVSGRLNEARLYAEDCLRGSDNSWMLHFGIDPDRYKRDIHEVLFKTYSGLAHNERFLLCSTPGEKIRSLAAGISYNFRYRVNLKLYRKYCLAAANAYGREMLNDLTFHPDPYVQYFNAFEDYPARAYTYLKKAHDFETKLIPEAMLNYNLEAGALFKKSDLIEQALAGLDPVWQKDMLSSCYTEFSAPKKIKKYGIKAENSMAEELFACNRGALRQEGISLPVNITYSFCDDITGAARTLQKALAKSGFTNSQNARYALNIKIEGSKEAGFTAACELTDSNKEIKPLVHTLPIPSNKKKDIYSFAGNLGNAVFTVE